MIPKTSSPNRADTQRLSSAQPPSIGPCAICKGTDGRPTYRHGRNITLCSGCCDTADEDEVNFFGDRADRAIDAAHDAECEGCRTLAVVVERRL